MNRMWIPIVRGSGIIPSHHTNKPDHRVTRVLVYSYTMPGMLQSPHSVLDNTIIDLDARGVNTTELGWRRNGK